MATRMDVTRGAFQTVHREKELSCSFAGGAVLPEEQFVAHLVSPDPGSGRRWTLSVALDSVTFAAHATDSISRSLWEITAETPSPRIVTP